MKLRTSAVAALAFALACSACGKKTPPASPDNAGAKSGSAMAPTGATGGTGYGGMRYGGSK